MLVLVTSPLSCRFTLAVLFTTRLSSFTFSPLSPRRFGYFYSKLLIILLLRFDISILQIVSVVREGYLLIRDLDREKLARIGESGNEEA